MLDNFENQTPAHLGTVYAALTRTLLLGSGALLRALWANPPQEDDPRSYTFSQQHAASVGQALALRTLMTEIDQLEGNDLRRVLTGAHTSNTACLADLCELAKELMTRADPEVATAANLSLSEPVCNRGPESPAQLGENYADHTYWLISAVRNMDVLREKFITEPDPTHARKHADGSCTEFDDFGEAAYNYYSLGAFIQNLNDIAALWERLDDADMQAVWHGLREASAERVQDDLDNLLVHLHPKPRHPQPDPWATA